MPRKYLLFSIFTFCFLFAFGVSAEGLKVLNEVEELSLVPGGAEHFYIEIQNDTDQDLLLQPVVTDYRFDEKGERINGDKQANPLVDSWIKSLNSDNLILGAGQIKRSVFLISIPPIAESKGYYASIQFIGESINSAEEFASNYSLIMLGVEQVDSNMYLRGGEIESFDFSKYLFYGPLIFDVRFKNLGKIHYKPTGKIDIYNSFNQKIETIAMPNISVLPGSSANFKTIWERKYFFGRYLIGIEMIDGEGNISVATKQFWAIPWKEFTILLIAFILILIANKVRGKEVSFN